LPGQYGGFCIAIILVCVLKEFLFAWRTYRLKPTFGSATESLYMAEPSSGPVQRRATPHVFRQTIAARVLGSFLYLVNLFFGYMIMLVLMTYNWGFFFCILFGSAVGHFVFTWWLAPEGGEQVDPDCCEK